MFRRFIAAAAAATMLATAVAAPAAACTGIVLTATDGAVLRARTLEFGEDPKSELIFIPRGQAMTATGPDGKSDGLTWTTKYATAGASAFGQDIILDGLNEAGLGGGLFYFPGYAGYQTVAPDEVSNSLGAYEQLT